MKEIILNFLKNNNLEIAELIQKRRISFNELNSWKRRYPRITNIEYDKNELSIYLKNLPTDTNYELYHTFSENLINLIKENSLQKVEGPNYLGMFDWQSDCLSVSIGLIDNPLSFEARFSFKLDLIK